MSLSSWGWPILWLCVLLLCKSLLKRWVWGPLWSIRETEKYEVLFSAQRLNALGCSTVVQSRLTRKNPPSSPLLWDGFPRRMPLSFHTGDYRVQAPVTLSMKDILPKHTVQALLCGKNVNFSVFKRKRGGNNLEIWTGSIPVHPTPLPPLSALFLSSSCLAFSNVFLVVCLIVYNSQHAWSAYFSCSKTTQNIIPSLFFPPTMLVFSQSHTEI